MLPFRHFKPIHYVIVSLISTHNATLRNGKVRHFLEARKTVSAFNQTSTDSFYNFRGFPLISHYKGYSVVGFHEINIQALRRGKPSQS